MKFKRLLPIAIATSLVLSSQVVLGETTTSLESADASAIEDPIIVPFWSYTNAAVVDITIKNDVAKPVVVIRAADNSAKISGELYLQKKVGSRWERVKTWSISGTGSLNIEKSYSVTSGETYRSRVVFDVEYNGDSEHIYLNSGSVTA